MNEHTIIIAADGRMRFVWDDALADLCEHGTTTVTRAGDVEPHPAGGWMADCSRVGGGIYGPYKHRQTALEHERAVVTGRLLIGAI